MNLTIENLKAAGAFTGAPVKKEIKWKQADYISVDLCEDFVDGENLYLLVRIGEAGDEESYEEWHRSEDGDHVLRLSEHTATTYVRRIGYAAAMADITSSISKSDPFAGRIASSICDAEGKAVFTPADITGEADPERGPMSRELVLELLRVMGEVNGAGKTKS
tara:strand:- start:144 stop:632 length:489 start_codon:yes stop_codon:yes gene_type:complete